MDFSQGVWTSIGPSNLGVVALRKHLTSVRHDQILSQLPQLVADLEEVEECRLELKIPARGELLPRSSAFASFRRATSFTIS